MIVCVSVNPAIDRRLHVGGFVPGAVHRADAVEAAAGGKAAHVAIAVCALGEPVVWIGFAGGATGRLLERGLREEGVDAVVVPTESETRTCIEIVDHHGRSTEVLEPGGEVTDRDVARLVERAEELFARFGAGTVVVLSGSLPPGAPVNLYATLGGLANRRGCAVFVDASGAVLEASLASAPDLVKPNIHEAIAVLGADTGESSPADIVERLVLRGAAGAAVTDGSRGILWRPRASDRLLAAAGPAIAGRSTVGCGDAALAGFAAGTVRGLANDDVLRLAVACGAANCFAATPGRIRVADVEKMAAEVEMQDPFAGNTRVPRRRS